MWLKKIVSRRLHERQARRPPARKAARPWPVTANALLLLVEGIGFLSLAALYLGPLGDDWPLTPEVWDADRIAAFTGLCFALLFFTTLVAAFGFLRLSGGAWLMAVLAQGANLLMALILYYQGRPAYVYLMMVYGIFMVLYLHQADVQAAFRPKTESPQQEHA